MTLFDFEASVGKDDDTDAIFFRTVFVRSAQIARKSLIRWRSLRDSNACYSLESAVRKYRRAGQSDLRPRCIRTLRENGRWSVPRMVGRAPGTYRANRPAVTGVSADPDLNRLTF